MNRRPAGTQGDAATGKRQADRKKARLLACVHSSQLFNPLGYVRDSDGERVRLFSRAQRRIEVLEGVCRVQTQRDHMCLYE